MKSSNSPRFVPLIVAFGIVFGLLLGHFYANQFSGKRVSIINHSGNKLNALLHLINDQYVDTVDISELVEKAMPQILKELDPHSTYIAKEDVEVSNQELKGSFSGIGIQFTIYEDTVRVIHVIKGGPSESVGLKAGDRIVSVDGESYVGKVVTNEETAKRLKGPKDSTVKLQVKRPGEAQLLSFSIVRGDVPVRSIDAVYMVDDATGYIRINNFGDTTYPEFIAALARLHQDGFKNLVIDLRGNLGGYMAPAVQIANEFLSKKRLIVYTLGRRSPREDYHSDGRGTYQNLPLVILVDEVSASASEILSGAIQDNDRGTIIGRRTFGKGLVQVPIEFRDGSMLRLTKSRYYTPSGRCVQKPYTPGNDEDYEQELVSRAEHGEYYSRDSIKSEGLKYKTSIGRTVYGGGGIIPDIFIPRDTLGMTSYFKDAYMRGLMSQYAYVYTDKNREELKKYSTLDALLRYLKRQNVVEKFADYADKNGLKRRNLMLRKSYRLFENHLFANIISDVLGAEAAVEYVNLTDPAMLKTLEVFRAGKAFPTLDASEESDSLAENKQKDVG